MVTTQYTNNQTAKNLIDRHWNGKTIRQRKSDGYINLTDMAKACGKSFKEWYKTNETYNLLQEAAEELNINKDELIDIVKDGDEQWQGAWGHRYVALEFANWLEPKFRLQVIKWTDELMSTGQVAIAQQDDSSQLQQAQQVSQMQILEQMMSAYKEQAQKNQEQDQKLKEQETKLKKHDREILSTQDELESTQELFNEQIENLRSQIDENRINPELNNAFFRIETYASIRDLTLDRGTAIACGKRLTRICNIFGFQVKEQSGQPNKYPAWLLKSLFDTAVMSDTTLHDLINVVLETYDDDFR